MKVYNKYKEKREKYLDEITDLYKEFLEKETGKKVNVDKESEKYIDYNQTYEHMYFQIFFKIG
jgi:benzoyl-CoA reductase/2-hydroxyglutaryl-CoA dehydratase subunit BcrC/BadD/HgdB